MGQLLREGVAFTYEEAGSGAPPIMLVHDLGLDHTCFAPQFEYFGSHHRVVAVDLRGHGRSDKPTESYAVALLADDLVWLCYELGLYRPVILGLGLGGVVALDLAARYQDLPSAIVAVASLPMPATASSLTSPQHVSAPDLEKISSWDHVAVAGGCAIPVLYVTLGIGEAALEYRPEAAPHLAASLSCRSRRRGEETLPEGINLLVDEFLSELTGRAPP